MGEENNIKELVKPLSTFDLKIPNTELKLKISFSGSEQDKKDLFELYKINGLIIEGRLKANNFLNDLLISGFEDKINKKFIEYLTSKNEFFNDIPNIWEEYIKMTNKSRANIMISGDVRIKNFKRKLLSDITDYFGENNLTSISKVINYLVKKELKKARKRDGVKE